MRYEGKKGEAWEAVRAYVKSVEQDCYTCDAKSLEGSNFQCGHFIAVSKSGSNNTLAWDERNIHAQCGNCNGKGEGQTVAYRAHLVSQYGQSVVQEMEARRWKVDPVKNWDKVIQHFEELTSNGPHLPLMNALVN